MWLRMVSKYPQFSIDGVPHATGKSWNEWERILKSGLQRKCGVQPVIEYLVNEHKLKPNWAQTIACQYVLGQPQHDA